MFKSLEQRVPNFLSGHISRFGYFVSALLVTGIPVLVAYLLFTLYLHQQPAQIFKYTPETSDETYYWHQAASFRVAGFDSGYYTFNEIPAAFSFSHYYAHGPLYSILFGSIGRWIGWEFYSAPLWNMFLMTIALALFIIITKPNIRQLLLIGVVMLAFWPAHLYMITNMREILFTAIAIILAALFYRIILNPDNVSLFYIIISGLIIVVATLFKATWGLLFLPYLLIIHKRLRLSALQAFVIAMVLIFIGNFVYERIVAPWPYYFVNTLLAALKISFLHGLKVFLLHTLESIGNLFNPDHNLLWIMLRLQLLLLIAVSGSLLWKLYQKDEITVRESIVVLTSCGFLFIEAILLYDIFDWRDFRLFMPIVLMSTLILVLRKRNLFVILMLLGYLAVIPAFLDNYNDFMANALSQDRQALGNFSEELASVIKYERNENAWCNTLLVPLPVAIDRSMLGVPAGIGISWFENPHDLETIKSRYLLIDQSRYKVLKDRAILDYQLDTALGSLYINRSANCEK